MSRLVIILAAFISSCGVAQVYSQSPLFAPGSPVVVGPGSGEIFLADLNHDGHLDLLTKHLLEKKVALHLGDGKGHFEPAGSTTVSQFHPRYNLIVLVRFWASSSS